MRYEAGRDPENETGCKLLHNGRDLVPHYAILWVDTDREVIGAYADAKGRPVIQSDGLSGIATDENGEPAIVQIALPGMKFVPAPRHRDAS